MQAQIHPTTFLPSFSLRCSDEHGVVSGRERCSWCRCPGAVSHFGLQQLTGEDSLRNSTEILANMAVSKHGLEKGCGEKVVKSEFNRPNVDKDWGMFTLFCPSELS